MQVSGVSSVASYFPVGRNTPREEAVARIDGSKKQGNEYELKQNEQKEPSAVEGSKAVGEADSKKSTELDTQQKKVVQAMKQRDSEVRRHEQAHVAAGGQYVKGGISYSYQRGPDGRQYAVGGEVSIDSGAASTPEKTIQKMQTVRSAALAPSDPSGADRSIASSAASNMAQARMQMASQVREEAKEAKETRATKEAEKSERIQKTQDAQGTQGTQGTEKTKQPDITSELLGNKTAEATVISSGSKTDVVPGYSEKATDLGSLLDISA